MADDTRSAISPWAIVLPLALGQFVASYAGSNMNVAINSIAKDLGTDVHGVQTAITLFMLTMAALMITGSKLTDIFGRKRCFIVGMTVYGVGALVAAAAPGLGALIFGYSLLEGIGSALMIPPIYILITVAFEGTTTRAKYFGIVSAAAGIGSAAGPLIGGLITSTISWRASFLLQVLIVAVIIYLARRIVDPPLRGPRPAFDVEGAVLSAAGLFFIVLGVLQSSTYGWGKSRQAFTIGGTVVIPKGGISVVWISVAIGVLILAWFFIHLGRRERAGKPPLFATRMLRAKISNLGLITQNMQWLVLQGTFFVVSVFLQTIRGFSAIQTGLALTPTTIGILLASAAAPRMARRRAQATLIRAGFWLTFAGFGLLALFARVDSNILSWAPGLFVLGAAVGIMLTASVNVVQSAWSDQDQGEISGISRSVSNLGSALGTAIVGSVLVSDLVKGNDHFLLAIATMAVFTGIGLLAAYFIPRQAPSPAPDD